MTSPDELVGRAAELGLLSELLHRAARGTGGAVLVDGDAGIGKSSFVASIKQVATDRGFTVLDCAGAPHAQSAGFSGLHEILQPLLGDLDVLPRRQAGALRVAFGFDDDGDPDRLLLGLAALGLLEEAAESAPVLVVVDDLHWLDASTVEVLSFLARRLAATRVLVLAASRPGRVVQEIQARFPDRVRLEPLSADDAGIVIERSAPALSPSARDLIIDTSLGNPLALTEFASAVTDDTRAATAGPARLPMTDRLEQTFLSEIHRLPEPTRRVLLLVAAAQGAALTEVMVAVHAQGFSERDFVPAEKLRVIRMHGARFEFRHPLIGSALYDAADSAARADAHRALAASTVDPGRAAWHRAAASTGWDESIASQLEVAALTSERHGALTESASAWLRSAELSPRGADRVRRMLAAAETARQAGTPALAAELIARVRPSVECEADELQLARTEWMLSQTTEFQGRSARELVELAQRLHGDDRIEVLVFAAVRAYILGESPEVADLVARELRAVTGAGDDVFRRIGLVLMEPAHGSSDVQTALEAFRGRLRPTDAVLLNCLAFSAEETNDLAAADTVWDAAVSAFHSASRTGDEATGLCGRGGLRITAGNVTAGLADAEQALHISLDLGLGVVGGMAAAQIAHARALRGEREAAAAALATMNDQVGDVPFARIAATAARAAAQLALNEGRYPDALDALKRTMVNEPVALWAGGDLAEASLRSGVHDDAVEDWLLRASRAADETASPHLRVLVERSRALAAQGADARAHFEAAIDAGMAAGATLDLAKARLFFGEWLRRERRIVEARSQLWEALRFFGAESLRPLAERAASELRAAGGVESSRPGVAIDAGRVLTGQELQVARLAAEGLTNKEIADQIYLSHRTVGAHLHRAFGKLGISRRSQLAGVLGAASRPSGAAD